MIYVELNASDEFLAGQHFSERTSCSVGSGMDDGVQDPVSELEGQRLGGWGLLQIAGGTGLAAYSVWALVLMPGFRKVPLKLQVPYMPASAKQVENVMTLLKGRAGKMADLGSGDGRIVLEAARRGFHPAVGYELNPWLLRLSYFYAWRSGYHRRVTYLREDLWKVKLHDCDNISIFLAPSVLALLEDKMLAELPRDARVVTGRFPLPTWLPSDILGEGIDRAWAYDVRTVRQAVRTKELGTEV
ncbi:adenine nucleotide translocase lysine N-methyltransferase isoform X1 [Hyla sarda]|uniref:adenine nucleotide translocase lysine N-methyltransferase isoform X1 n=2 Tax=Hyla sarda TaxID=327740 RepID=UPI0024C237BE|nr:adenine nucleotide translocase lysine N-methyltransferase isoform X1 [Hyla sarda]